MADFVGQSAVKQNLLVFIRAAVERGEALDHVLLYGPPGLGKTTLAGILAYELGVAFKATSAPVYQNAAELLGVLTHLEARQVLFLDEVHRLGRVLEEHLYPAMEDFRCELVVDRGPNARHYTLQLPPFTLVGATTRAGMISAPLRNRFGVVARLISMPPRTCSSFSSAPPASWSWRPMPTGWPRSPGAAAARRASPTACSDASGISPRWKGMGA